MECRGDGGGEGEGGGAGARPQQPPPVREFPRSPPAGPLARAPRSGTLTASRGAGTGGRHDDGNERNREERRGGGPSARAQAGVPVASPRDGRGGAGL